jgi:hypothetical protein
MQRTREPHRVTLLIPAVETYDCVCYCICQCEGNRIPPLINGQISAWFGILQLSPTLSCPPARAFPTFRFTSQTCELYLAVRRPFC